MRSNLSLKRSSHRALAKTLMCVAVLSACSWGHKTQSTGTPDNEPTIKSLAGRKVVVNEEDHVASSNAQAIEAYKNFLAIAPKAAQRAEAMRRIGDLEMDSADGVNTQGDPDFTAAIASYLDYLKAYPDASDNDRILYQLARGQEQSGDLTSALQTLRRLVNTYPHTAFTDEARFRIGELLFATGDYAHAEQSYAALLQSGQFGKFYYRALYMQGWCQFKQGQLEQALESFYGVLDLKLGDRQGEGGLDTIPGLSRADLELLEDTFRVSSLSLENLQGAETIPGYMTTPVRHAYEYRVYEQLGELYLKQERVKDAADTFTLFARQNPLHGKAPVLQARVIEIYAQNGFATLALQAKKEYVLHYGSDSAYRTANPFGWDKAQYLVKLHLGELARYYHASAQKTKSSEDYTEAIHWYRMYLASFPEDKDAAENNFLLAELLFEAKRYPEASTEYENTAYQFPDNPRSADAGYAALLAYAKQLETAEAAQKDDLQRATVASELKFAGKFGSDPRAAPVLANAAEKLINLKDYPQAASVAQKIIYMHPIAPEEQRRVAWTVLAYTTFEEGDYQSSEEALDQVLKLTAANAPNRNDLIERQAAAIYKQGEQARSAGDLSKAVNDFTRVGNVAPDSPIRATAQFDAAAALIALKEWDKAAALLEDFRKRYPKNPLNAEVGSKLAAVYLEKGQWQGAATELDTMAAKTADSKEASDMLWQAAELYDKAASAESRAAAAKDYEKYLALNKQNIPLALEARYRLALIAKQDNNPVREQSLMKDILVTEQNGGKDYGRTDRTRFLGATAALAMAEPVAESYRKVALVEPLKKNLKLKKTRMEDTLKAYSVATSYGVADVSTEATFKIASTYRDFGKALLASERPAKMSKAEREQYDVLLEEQAFPFEEKAIDIHEVNAQRSAAGIYDKWVKESFTALAELKPARYGKTERESLIPLPDQQIRQGIEFRKSGQFDKALASYQDAISRDAKNSVAMLDLGILYDLYMDDREHALEMYNAYLNLHPDGDAEVSKWIKEVKSRKPVAAPPQAADAQKKEPS